MTKGQKAYNYIHSLRNEAMDRTPETRLFQRDTKTQIPDWDSAYYYYQLSDIRELDKKISAAFEILQSEDTSAGEKANARRTLSKYGREYAMAQL